MLIVVHCTNYRDRSPQDLYTMTICGVDKPGKAFFVKQNKDLNRNSTGFK